MNKEAHIEMVCHMLFLNEQERDKGKESENDISMNLKQEQNMTSEITTDTYRRKERINEKRRFHEISSTEEIEDRKMVEESMESADFSERDEEEFFDVNTDSDVDALGHPIQKKRGKLPSKATKILKKWFMKHVQSVKSH